MFLVNIGQFFLIKRTSKALTQKFVWVSPLNGGLNLVFQISKPCGFDFHIFSISETFGSNFMYTLYMYSLRLRHYIGTKIENKLNWGLYGYGIVEPITKINQLHIKFSLVNLFKKLTCLLEPKLVFKIFFGGFSFDFGFGPSKRPVP